MRESAAPQEMSLFRRYGVALKYSDYRRFWLSATFAGAGSWGLIAARGTLAFDLSGSAFWVGLTTFAALIPFVVVPPFSGILADRFDRRFLIAMAHASNVLLALLLVWLFFSDTIELWHLPIISLLSGIVRGVQMPAQSALVPNLVSRDDLLNAVALNNVSLQGARVIGGLGVIGALQAADGSNLGWAFVLAAVGYMIAMVMVLSIRTASTGAIARGDSLWTVVTAGVVYAWKTPTVGLMLIFVAFHCAMTMAFESIMPLHGRDKWGAALNALPYFLTAFGFGAILGVIIIAGIRNEKHKGIALLISAFGSSIGVLWLGLAPSLITGLSAAFIMGVTQAPFMALAIAYIQGTVPDAIRGRVSSLFAMSALSFMAIINAVNGLIADMVGSVPVILVSGGLFFIIAIITATLVTNMRRVMFEGFSFGAPARAPAPVPSGGSE